MTKSERGIKLDFTATYPNKEEVRSIELGEMQQGEVYKAANGDYWMVCNSIKSPLHRTDVVGISPNNLGFLMDIEDNMEIHSHYIAKKIKIELEMP